MRKIVTRLACAAMIVISYNLPALAFLGDVIPVGVRAGAMGEAFVAIADDYSASYYNPAGLGQLTDNLKMTIDFIYQAPQFEITELDTGKKLSFKASDGHTAWDPNKTASGDDLDDLGHNRTIIGISANLNKICSALNIPRNLTLGMTIMIPNNMEQMMVLTDFTPEIPKLTRFGDPDEQIFIVFGLGAEIYKDLLYIGLSGKVGIYGDGDVHNNSASVSGQSTDPDASPDDEHMVFQMQVDWRVFGGLHPIVGVLFTPFDKKLKIGATYRQETSFSIGPCSLLMNYRSSPDEQGTMMPWNAKLEFIFGYSPEEWALGIAYVFDALTLSIGIEYQKWGDFWWSEIYDIEYTKTAEYGLPDAKHIPKDPNFDDIINTSIAVEYRHTSNLTIIAGYRNMPTPVPDQSDLITNYIDMDKDAFSFGCSYSVIKDFISIGAMFEYMICENYEVYNDGMTGLIPWSYNENDLVYAHKSFKVKGDVYSIGLSMEINF